MKQIFRHIAVFFLAWAYIIGIPAKATTYTFNLWGNPSNISVSTGNNGSPYISEWLSLVNNATGLSQTPGFTLSVGDIITGTCQLNNALTVPAGLEGQEFLVYLIDSSGSASNIYSDATVTFYDKGVEVTPDAFNAFGGSGGSFSFGGFSNGVPVPAFTFDEITFNATITSILDDSYGNISSVVLPDGAPNLSVVAFGATLSSGTLDVTYNAATDVPVTSSTYNATGVTVNFTLNYAPTPGTTLTVIKNTGLPFITGTFNNLAQGQIVPLTYNGATYDFVANYYGGKGNDLVLQWADNQPCAWGYGYDGQLGNDGFTDSFVPGPVDTSGVLAGKTITAVAAGGSHSLALCSDGTVAAWGYGYDGELGNGSFLGSDAPVAVDLTGALAGKTVVAISAGDYFSLALCSDGSVAAWGYNHDGELGNGSTVSSAVPVAVPALGALEGKAVVAISAGGYHSLALCSDGTVVAWGYGADGELGNYNTTNSSVPVLVDTGYALGEGETVVAVSAGKYHSLALTSFGNVIAWGYNADGELGNSGTTNSPVPVAVNTSGALSVDEKIIAVSAGGYHSLALGSFGDVISWGNNGYGQLGDNGAEAQSSVPVAVNTSGVLSGETVVSVSAGEYHSLAFCSNGTVAAWGLNSDGELGDGGAETESSVPVDVSTYVLSGSEIFTLVATGAGASHSVGIVATVPQIFVMEPFGIYLTTGSSTVDFGTVVLGNSNQLTFTVGDNGSGVLSNLALSATGGDVSDFQLGTLGNTTVAPGYGEYFTVTFSPLGVGPRATTLVITSNDPATPSFTIGLTGTGTNTPPTYNVTTSSSPTAGGSTSGGGTYVSGTTATVLATPAEGYSFVNWTEGEAVVSTSASYLFTVTGNVSLVAHFTPITYTVATSSSPEAGGSTSGGGLYNSGTTATVVATPAEGYAFVNWTEGEEVVSASATYQFTVTGNVSLVAHFTPAAPATYTVTTSPSPAAGGSTGGGGSFTSGASATVTAAPASGYVFLNWTQNGVPVSTSAIYQFTVTGNVALVANFAPPTCNVTTSPSPAAGGSTSGGGTFSPGATATVVATPASGYTFVNWTQGGTPVSTSASYAFTVTGNVALVANFTPIIYTVTTSPSPLAGGSTSGGGSFKSGATATVIATPAAGYTFVNWTQNGIPVSTLASYAFTVTGNVALVANFTPTIYNVTTSHSPAVGGSASGGGAFISGATATVIATPASGYAFVNWEQNGTVVSTSATYQFTVTGNVALVANFAAITPGTYDVTTSPLPSAGGSASGGGPYNSGSTATVVAAPAAGYAFVNWTQGGAVASTLASYAFTVTGNVSLVANFTPITYNVATNPSPSAGGSTSGGGTYNSGVTATVMATPASGYIFANWTHGGSVVSTSASYPFTVTGNVALVANFTQLPPVITSTLAASGSTGGFFTYSITATNQPSSFNATPLPAGLAVVPGTGTISGTPAVSGTFQVGLSASNLGGTGSATLVLTIVPPPPEITGGLSAAGVVGQAFADQIVATNSPTLYTASGALPPGLSLDASTGLLSGTPTVSGSFQVPVSAVNSSGTGSGVFDVLITDSLGFHEIDLSPYANNPIGQAITTNPQPPTGNVTLGNVPFLISTIWNADVAAPHGGEATVTVPVNLGNVSEIHLLMNTHWGQPKVLAHINLIFDTGTYTKDLLGNSDIRDYQNWVFTNKINKFTTINVFSAFSTLDDVTGRIDKMVIAVPPQYQNARLLDVEAVDDGARYIQRLLVMGITARVGPAPVLVSVQASPAGAGTVASGTSAGSNSVTVSATPNPGWHFVAWKVSGTTVSTSPDYQFIPQGPEALTAKFGSGTGYTLDVSGSAGGTVSQTPDAGSYAKNANVTLTATADPGYLFEGWSGSVASSSNPLVVKVKGNMTETATFALGSFAVKSEAKPAAGGTVTGAGTFQGGAGVTVTAVPAPGYRFEKWTENSRVVSTDASYHFEAGRSRHLVANFARR